MIEGFKECLNNYEIGETQPGISTDPNSGCKPSRHCDMNLSCLPERERAAITDTGATGAGSEGGAAGRQRLFSEASPSLFCDCDCDCFPGSINVASRYDVKSG